MATKRKAGAQPSLLKFFRSASTKAASSSEIPDELELPSD